MKTLKTLIKLQKREVDRIREELATLLERQQVLQDEHDGLEKELERESQVATEFPEVAISFAEYAKRTTKRMKDLLRTIAKLQEAIDAKRDELQEAFGEQKKLEIALEQKELERFNHLKQLEIKKMDEVALRGFSRRGGE